MGKLFSVFEKLSPARSRWEEEQNNNKKNGKLGKRPFEILIPPRVLRDAGGPKALHEIWEEEGGNENDVVRVRTTRPAKRSPVAGRSFLAPTSYPPILQAAPAGLHIN